MKQIIATLGDGSQICHKTVADDFDVEEWAEKRKHNFQQLNITSIKIERIPMTIYVLQKRRSDRILGMWTTLDNMINWIGELFADCGDGEPNYQTPLDEFMNEHRVMAYQDGAGDAHEIIDWAEIIPQ